MIRLQTLAGAALLLAAGSAFATQTVGAAPGTPGTDLGTLDTLGSAEIFSDNSVALSGGSFSDTWTFSIAAQSASGGGSVSSYDVYFNPASSSGFSFTNLANVTLSVYSQASGIGGTPLFTTSSSNGSLSNVMFALSQSSSPYDLVISGQAQALTASAGYTGTIMAAAVPEPGTWALMAAGLLAVGGVARRRAAGR